MTTPNPNGIVRELVDHDFEWRDRAACRGLNVKGVDPFFPELGQGSKQAKAICAGCDVRDTCLAWALDNDVQFGIWGGLSTRERRALTRKRIAA
jgi:WhiB family transcriptional regulator, redox-sensing transcriptional regulator